MRVSVSYQGSICLGSLTGTGFDVIKKHDAFLSFRPWALECFAEALGLVY